MEYQLIADDNLSLFMELINHYIGEGWKLQGGVATALKPDGKIQYTQAMMHDNSGEKF